MPHGTLEAAAQAPQQTRSSGALIPGGLVHVVPAVHIAPTPGQVRHARPVVSIAAGIVSPHGTALAAAQLGQHASMRQVAVPSQRVPRPVQSMLPMQVSGMSVPQSTISAARQPSPHSQAPATHVRPSVHGPSHSPPQPSDVPHVASMGQLGMHSQRPVSGLHSSRGPGHGPTQKPPHPSGAPHAASAGQRGTHVQRPAMQRSGGMHGGSQSHVGTQVPFWQISPRAQVTPKHGLGRQVPARQNSPSAHVMPSHAERGVHVKWHASASAQRASHGTIGAQLPRAGSQNSPAGHDTPSHATGRQPAKHSPATHVSSAAQRTPSQGSTSATQTARHRSPSAVHGLAVAHGSA